MLSVLNVPNEQQQVHPVAWWIWALGLAVATTRSPGITETAILISSVIVVVTLCRRPSAPARVFAAYLAVAASIVVIRVVFYVIVGIKSGSDVLVSLPRIPLPDWAAGISLLGPVTASGLQAVVAAGLALAALLLCFGAASALTSPQRTLRTLPASLHLVGTSAIIAMSVAPQLVTSWQRVHRAHALRGSSLSGVRALAATTLPVLQDALERSIALAASMDSRGYARVRPGSGGLVLTLLIGALLGTALGIYAVLDGTSPRWLAITLLAVGGATAIAGSLAASRRVVRTAFRPDIWRIRETIIAGCGVAVAALAVASWQLGDESSAGPALLVAFLFCGVLAIFPVLVGRTR